MGDAVLEDFRGKDCAFVASWLRGKGLNKLCAVFEVFKFWNFQALNVWMYFIVVFTMKYNTYTGDSIQQHKIK